MVASILKETYVLTTQLNMLKPITWSPTPSISSHSPLSPPPPQFPNLTSFLLFRASRSTQLANYFYWFLSVECSEDKDTHAMAKYERIRLKFLEDLKNVSVCSGVKLMDTN